MLLSMTIRYPEMNKSRGTRRTPFETNTSREDPCFGQALWALLVSSPGIIPAATFASLTGVNPSQRAM